MPEDGVTDVPVTVTVEEDTTMPEARPMSEQIAAQMEQQIHNSNRRLDDVAERFGATMSFTEARSNQQWQTGSMMLFPILQNQIEKTDLAQDALRKKIAENSAPSTQGTA